MAKKKSTFNWLELKGEKISILVDNPLPDGSGCKESYVGKIEEEIEDFIFLSTPRNTKISLLIIRKRMILSIWIYKN